MLKLQDWGYGATFCQAATSTGCETSSFHRCCGSSYHRIEARSIKVSKFRVRDLAHWHKHLCGKCKIVSSILSTLPLKKRVNKFKLQAKNLTLLISCFCYYSSLLNKCFSCCCKYVINLWKSEKFYLDKFSSILQMSSWNHSESFAFSQAVATVSPKSSKANRYFKHTVRRD